MPGRIVENSDSVSLQQNMNDHDTRLPECESPQNGTLPASLGPLDQPSKVSDSQFSKPKPQVNGFVSPSKTSALAPEDSKPAAKEMASDIPPEISHVSGGAAGFVPLNRLCQRIAQECYNSLLETTSDLQQVSVTQQVNGTGPTDSAAEASPASAQKRLQWLEFANAHRERFIKLLVLTQWTRTSSADISRLVDVMKWMVDQQQLCDTATDSIGEFKREIKQIRLPNPDIDTAIEVLSTGKSSRMPDLSYLPHDPLSSQQVVDALHNIDMLLHVRLNVHENLPKHFRKFSVHDGRVTFTVAHEFELDLSIYDDDPTFPFYFLDFRFLFSPASEIPPGQLRGDLEYQCNAILAQKGLSDCYDFLHDFVLTYKLGALRQQAFELARTTWVNSLQIERHHRSVIIQYWCQRSGRRNWIEIGITSGKAADKYGVRASVVPSQLFMRWLREGKEVPLAQNLQTHLLAMDLTQILKIITKQHIHYLLSRISQAISVPITTEKASFGDTSSETDLPTYQMSLPLLSPQGLTLRMELVSGQFKLSPTSPSTVRCLKRLNSARNPGEEVPPQLGRWIAAENSMTVKTQASKSGWSIDEDVKFDPRPRKEIFGPGNFPIIWMRCWADPHWIVAATPGPSAAAGTSFYILQVEKTKPGLYDTGNIRVIQHHSAFTDVHHLAGDFFDRLERFTMAKVSAFVVRDQLGEFKIHHEFALDEPHRQASFPPMKLGNPHRLTLSHVGPTRNRRSGRGVVHMIRGLLIGNEQVFSLLASVRSRNVIFGSDGSFTILENCPLGDTNIVSKLFKRLKEIRRLNACLEEFIKHGLQPTSISLHRISFRYDAQPSESLSASVSWLEDGTTSLSLDPPSNPHIRIQPMFNRSLQKPLPPRSTASFTNALLLTLPLLHSFDKIETRPSSPNPSPNIYTADGLTFVLTYSRPRAIVKIQFIRRQGEGWWYIDCGPAERTSSEAKDVSEPRGAPGRLNTSTLGNGQLPGALQEFFKKRSDGILGLGNGIAVRMDNVPSAVEEVDEIFRNLEDSPIGSTSATQQNDGRPGSAGGPSASSQPPLNNSAPAPELGNKNRNQGQNGKSTQQSKQQPKAQQSISQKRGSPPATPKQPQQAQRQRQPQGQTAQQKGPTPPRSQQQRQAPPQQRPPTGQQPPVPMSGMSVNQLNQANQIGARAGQPGVFRNQSQQPQQYNRPPNQVPTANMHGAPQNTGQVPGLGVAPGHLNAHNMPPGFPMHQGMHGANNPNIPMANMMPNQAYQRNVSNGMNGRPQAGGAGFPQGAGRGMPGMNQMNMGNMNMGGQQAMGMGMQGVNRNMGGNFNPQVPKHGQNNQAQMGGGNNQNRNGSGNGNGNGGRTKETEVVVIE